MCRQHISCCCVPNETAESNIHVAGISRQACQVQQSGSCVALTQALQQLAQAATLATRGCSYEELMNVSRQLQSVSVHLLHRLQSLLTPVPAVAWGMRPLPDPQLPVLVAMAPESPAADATAVSSAAGKGAAADKKVAAGSKAAAGDKKQAGTGSRGSKQAPAGATPRDDAKHTLMPDCQKPHAGMALRYALTLGWMAA